MAQEIDLHSLVAWFKQHKRDFPWRKSPTPYHVWVSEVMLQQTQASVVVGYFKRWMQLFPSLQSLASSPEEQVIKAWEGLGYYQRVRALQKAAIKIVEEKEGKIPQEEEDLLALPGIGKYTAAAILSFGFGKKAAAVDVNVARVISRLYMLSIRKRDIDKVIPIVEKLLPENKPSLVMEALIELGALVCKKTPDCPLCPIKKECLSYKKGQQLYYPLKEAKPPITYLHRKVWVLVCHKEGKSFILLKKNDQGKRMQGLFQFPWVEKGRQDALFDNLKEGAPLPPVKHGFTRFSATLYPELFFVESCQDFEGYKWVEWKDVENLPFCSGHRKIVKKLQALKKEEFIQVK